MYFEFLYRRIVAILSRPMEEWQIIKKESATTEALFTRYAMILAAIPAVAGFLGTILFGQNQPAGGQALSPGESFRLYLFSYLLSLAGVYLLSFIIDYLSPYFGTRRDMVTSVKVVVFSNTATWIAGILLVFPGLAIMTLLLSLYSLYLMYIGLRILKEVPGNKMAGYFTTIIITSILISVISTIFIGFLMGSPSILTT